MACKLEAVAAITYALSQLEETNWRYSFTEFEGFKEFNDEIMRERVKHFGHTV